ncbi:MAG: formylglycine-generating enzyme family protein [Treponema sp.]|nr:formylglycine-generating enzyme family protein [Treponema sp.]
MKKFFLRMITVCTVTAVAVTMALFFAGCSESSGNPNESNNPNTPNTTNNPNNPDNGNSAKNEMVQIPGGSFQMGDTKDEGENDEKPVHEVTLTGFSMSKYEVTQAQYQAVMGSNPSYFDGVAGRKPASGEVQGNRPVENVSWYDAIVFCNKLSMAENLSPAYSISGSTNPADWGNVPESNNSTWNAVTIVSGSTGYRLPTEAQWEYAAKGGNGSPGNYSYAGSNTAGEVAWTSENSNDMTHEVGKKSPNDFGLYDMSGNVWEWCWDRYGDYPSEAQIDPTGAASGSFRVNRGGSWNYYVVKARSVYRGTRLLYSGSNYIGFRLVRP